MKVTRDLRRWVRSETRVAENLSAWLNGFRAAAALVVVLSHASPLVFGDGTPDANNPLGGFVTWLAMIGDRGHDAVIVFFVLSGYLVGGPFLVRFAQNAERLGDYAAARIARLYVVVLPAIALTLVLDHISLGWLDGQSFVDLHREDFFPDRGDLYADLSLGTTTCNALFLQTIWCYQIGSNLSFWSLSNEALYYLVWPSLVLGTRNRRALWPAAAAGLILLSSDLLPFGRAFTYLVYFMIWAAGAACFALARERLTPWRVVGFAAIAFALLAVSESADAPPLVNDAALAAAFIATLLLLELTNLRGPPGRKLWTGGAAFSFSLYATHLPVIMAALLLWRRFGPNGGHWRNALFLMAVGIAVVAAAPFYALTERHTDKVRAWIRHLPLFRPRARTS